MNPIIGRQGRLQRNIALTAAIVLGSLPVSPALSDGFWPLGDKVPVETLKEEYIPFKGKDEIPNRPAH